MRRVVSGPVLEAASRAALTATMVGVLAEGWEVAERPECPLAARAPAKDAATAVAIATDRTLVEVRIFVVMMTSRKAWSRR
jgi:hypothetical protein